MLSSLFNRSASKFLVVTPALFSDKEFAYLSMRGCPVLSLEWFRANARAFLLVSNIGAQSVTLCGVFVAGKAHFMLGKQKGATGPFLLLTLQPLGVPGCADELTQ